MGLIKKIVALSLVMSLSGCYSLTYNAASLEDGSVSMTRNPEARVVKRFKSEERAIWIAGGLFPLVKPNFEAAIHRESLGRKVQGLTIQSEMNLVDTLLYFGAYTLFSLILAGASATAAQDPTKAGQYYLLAIAGAFGLPHFRTITIEGEVISGKRKPIEDEPEEEGETEEESRNAVPVNPPASQRHPGSVQIDPDGRGIRGTAPVIKF